MIYTIVYMRLCCRHLCWDLGRTNSPISARHGDSLGYIRIWATPPRRLVFWDGSPSPYKWYQSHDLNLFVYVGDVRSPKAQWKTQWAPVKLGFIKIELSREIIMLQVLHVRRVALQRNEEK